jgi:methyl-accepting chemotaxis protein
MAVAQNNTNTIKSFSSHRVSIRLFMLCITLGFVTGVAFFVYGNLLHVWDYQSHGWFMAGCLLGGLGFGLLNYLLFSKLYLRSLHKVVDVIDAVGAGDLSAQCKMDTDINDVVGRIAYSVNRMSRNLHSNITHIAESTNKVSNAVSKMATGQSAADAYADPYLAQKYGLVDRRAKSRNAGSATSVSPVMRNRRRSTTAVRTNPNPDSDINNTTANTGNRSIRNPVSSGANRGPATDTNAEVNKGTSVNSRSRRQKNANNEQKNSVQKVAQRAEQKKTATQKDSDKSAKNMQQLEQESREISKVLDIIQNIAQQTNLLALNAAIDAAKAGEPGRGFAVVADEDSALALRTQKSTLEIKRMIDQLQYGAGDVAKAMDTAVEKVKQRMSDSQEEPSGREVSSSSQSLGSNLGRVSNRFGAKQNTPNSDTTHFDRNREQTIPASSYGNQSHSEISRLVEELRKAISRFKR